MPESDDEANNNQYPTQQPGTVISPGSAPQPVANPQQPQVQQPLPQQLPSPTQPIPQQPQQQFQPPAVPPQPETQPPFNQQAPEPAASAAESSEGAVTWTATEFIAHNKTSNWYVSLAGAALGLSVIFYLFTRDAVTVVVVIAAAIILGIYGSRKPRLLDYRVDTKGLTIGGKHHAYKEFKSFTIIPEDNLTSIELMPLKRFAPIMTIYFAPQDEEVIAAALSTQLPYEEPRRDAVDSLMRRIRF